MKRSAAIIVFGRVPVPGEVKTRLVPTVSPENAARLYEAFLLDTVDALQSADADLRLYLAPSSTSVPDGTFSDEVQVFKQRGAALGDRMLLAFVETFAAGYERVVIVGSDSPTLPVEFVGLALEVLAEPYGIVIGPASDGGYYLLGMNELYPALFQGIEYSRDDVFVNTIERASGLDASVTVLPEWYDVDTPDALSRLREELAAGDHAAPRTQLVLESIYAGRSITSR